MKKSQPLTFLFENPNSPATFENILKQILLEKLLAELSHPEASSAAKYTKHRPL